MVRLSTAGDKAAGSVYGYVDVPELTRDTLALSGLRLSRGGATTLRRTFSSEDDVEAEIQIHRSGRPGSIDVRVLDGRNREVAAQQVALAAPSFSEAGIANYRMPLPLRGLRPGEYLLVIEAADDKRTERRDVRFSVK
jgi:hypothetical protein